MNICYICIIIFYLGLSDGKLFRFDYDYHQDAEGWMKLHHIPATWKDARLHCYREGAVLASPENVQMLATMKSVLQNSQMSMPCGIFTGTHATYSKGYYYSIGGTPLSRMPVAWAPGEPDNADNGEDCLLMLPKGTFADVNCSAVYPYICYRKKTPDTAVTNCGTVDNGYTLDNRTGSCYKFHTDAEVWDKAFAACSGEGGHLAIINSPTEAQVLKELFAKHPASSMPGQFSKNIVLIGYSEWDNHDLWMNIHGQTLKEAGYAVWADGQPDHTGSDPYYCGAMFTNGQLDDTGCNWPCPFICEKKPDSLLSDDDI